MVNIKASYRVVPSEPTPKGPFWLSEIDVLFQPAIAYIYLIYVYKPTHQHTAAIDGAVEELRDSLSKILVHYYPLAGRLRYIKGGRCEVDCNEMGAILLECESTKSAEEYGRFAPNETIRELVPMVDLSKPIEDSPLLVVQLTRLKCGTLCVGIQISHVLFDGESAIRFINSWAKITRKEMLDEEEMPFIDRTILKRPEPVKAPRFEHYEFNPLPGILHSNSSVIEESKKEKNVALMKLSNEQVEKLKNKANDRAVTMDDERKEIHQRPYTRFESICAHTWRCVAKARQNDPLQPTAIVIVVDFRKRLKPPLPQNYLGNAITHPVTPICLSGDIISEPLSYAASKIREAVDTMTDEYLRSQHDFFTGQVHLDWNRTTYRPHESLGNLFFGNPNMLISSWMRMDLYGADFGWGKPVYVGQGAMPGDGVLFILPGPNEDGSFLITICLQNSHLEAFKTFFYQDI